jgi:hypothetical protein
VAVIKDCISKPTEQPAALGPEKIAARLNLNLQFPPESSNNKPAVHEEICASESHNRAGSLFSHPLHFFSNGP